MALQILGRKLYKNTEKSSLYSQSHLVFIHKTPLVLDHPTTREIRELLWSRSTPRRIRVYFYTSSSLIYILQIHRRVSNVASDEDIMEKNHLFAMLWNLSVISHKIVSQCFFFISGAKSSLYSQSHLVFIHKTPLVLNHPTTREIRELLRPRSTPRGIRVYFYMSSSLIYILQIHRRVSNVASDEDIMEKNHLFAMLWNLSVII